MNAGVVDKVVYILRGCPGSGKSTLARELRGETGCVFSTDDLFVGADGEYAFDPNKVAAFHKRTQELARAAVSSGCSPVVVDNTNTTAWEMRPYVEMALRRGYRVEFVEPDTPWRYDALKLTERNSHGVGLDVIRRMLKRFQKNVSVETVMGKRMSKFPANRTDSSRNENTPIAKTPDLPNESQLSEQMSAKPTAAECDVISQGNVGLYNPFLPLLEENVDSELISKNRNFVPDIYEDDLLGVRELLNVDFNPFLRTTGQIPDILTGQDIPFDSIGNDADYSIFGANCDFPDLICVEEFTRANSSQAELSSGIHRDYTGECYVAQERNVTIISTAGKEKKVRSLKTKYIFLRSFRSRMLFEIFSSLLVSRKTSKSEIKFLDYLFIKSLIPFCLRKKRLKKCLNLLFFCLRKQATWKHSICQKMRNVNKVKVSEQVTSLSQKYRQRGLAGLERFYLFYVTLCHF